MINNGIQQLCHHPYARIGLIVFFVFVVLSFCLPVLVHLSPDEIQLDTIMAPPSIHHIFGTDDLGRDVFARVLYGGRVSLTVGFIAVIIAIIIGSIVGALAGFYGGLLDQILMRLVDILLSIPLIFLLLTIQVMLKPSLVNVMIVIGCTSWMGVARLVRAEFLKIKHMTYVKAKKAFGFSDITIIFKTILPNASGPIVVAATLGMAGAIMTESVLSFFGLGVQLPQASWGSMLTYAQEYMFDAWWLAAIPGILIVMSVLALNFIGEGIRDIIGVRQ